MIGGCGSQLVTVGQAKVGVAQSHWQNEDPPRFAQWAGCRHPDGAVVKVAQISSPDPYAHRFGVLPELKKLPFTVEQLAEPLPHAGAGRRRSPAAAAPIGGGPLANTAQGRDCPTEKIFARSGVRVMAA
jgi:hypothetical protein